MKQIRNCGECGFWCTPEDDNTPHYCRQQGRPYRTIVNYPDIPEWCPLPDAEPCGELAGKLRKKIESAKRQSSLEEESNRVDLLEDFLYWIELAEKELSISPPAPPSEPVRVKGIEWREIDEDTLDGFINEEFIVKASAYTEDSHKKRWEIKFNHELEFLTRSYWQRISYKTLEQAQRAAQEALNAFVKGLIE